MIISHKYKFIFLKTRKTAGTSLEIALSKFCGDTDILTTMSPEDQALRHSLGYPGPQNDLVSLWRYSRQEWKYLLFDRERARFFNHTPADRAFRWIGPKIWRSYYKFSFERNPWDKAVSLYYFHVNGPMKLKLTFPEYLRQQDPTLTNYPIYSLNGQVAVDFLGRFETMEADLETITRTLGLPEKLELPRTKTGFRKDKRPYQELYGPEEIRIISEKCRKEIDLLQYTF